jgi:cob(I)alamin adenosyltransferase
MREERLIRRYMAKVNFYTRTGDNGTTTRLGGHTRVKKTSQLMDVLGTVDEATSNIGVARAVAQHNELHGILSTAQRHLMALMSHLSATPEARKDYPGLSDKEVMWLENVIARLEKIVPPLDHLIIPGDSRAGAAFHVARAVVRRAERKLSAFSEAEPTFGHANLVFMNRLSSLLFVASLVEDQIAVGDRA